jgi:hypothetical protein
MDSALKIVEKCWRSKEGLKGAFVYSVPYFLASALIALEHWKRTALGRKRLRYWRIFRKNHRRATIMGCEGESQYTPFGLPFGCCIVVNAPQ